MYNTNKLTAKFEDTSIVMLPFTKINVTNKSLLASLKAIYYINKNIDQDNFSLQESYEIFKEKLSLIEEAEEELSNILCNQKFLS